MGDNLAWMFARRDRSPPHLQFQSYTWGVSNGIKSARSPKWRDYLLLLYRLNGPNADELGAFRWQLCRADTE